MEGPAFAAVRDYIRDVFAGKYARASAAFDEAIAAEGLGAINGALSDAGRSLLDQIRYAAGTIDVLAEIETLASRIVDIAVTRGDDRQRREELERQKALIVFLGSEGLPCAARATVASWPPLDRLHALTHTVVGLVAAVAERDNTTPLDLAADLDEPGDVTPALGTFSLAWRDEHGRPSVLAGAIPRGQTAHITFLGTGTASLRSVFARVAFLAMPRPNAPGMRQSLGPAVEAS
jgi:hypothetical protein